MKDKKTLLALVAMVAVLAVLAGIYLLTRPDTVQGEKTFTVTVIHADGTQKDFTYTSAEEYLGAVLEAEGLIVGEQGDYGLFIKTVDGETADYSVDKSYWAFYEGENYAEKGIDLTPIADGGVYKLVYTAEEA